MPEEQAEYLHEQVRTPEGAPGENSQVESPTTGTASKIEHHLVSLEQHLGTIEGRIDEVKRALDGQNVETIAGGGPEDVIIAAGRLREAVSNALIATHQIYALCAVLKRDDA